MSQDSDVIVIKGGSVAIVFNEGTYTGKNGKYGNQHKQIVSVEVTDDNTKQTQTISIPADGKCTISINTR